MTTKRISQQFTPADAPWTLQNKIPLCDPGEEFTFINQKVSYLRPDQATSVEDAVKYLNMPGVSEDLGNNSGHDSLFKIAPSDPHAPTDIVAVFLHEAGDWWILWKDHTIARERVKNLFNFTDESLQQRMSKTIVRKRTQQDMDALEAAKEGKAHGASSTEHQSIKQKGESFMATHQSFMFNIKLAVSTAMYVTLFGIPAFAPISLQDSIFGNSTVNMTGHISTTGLVCDAHMLKRVKIVGGLRTQLQVPWVWENDDWTGEYPEVWCGWLPSTYKANWGGVVQMIVFTVFMSTGNTVELAWQGFVGTAFAVVNVTLLSLIYPTGARTLADNTYVNAYSEGWCWANFLVVLFLFLICRADQNTIKFGMSWHVSFMLQFMHPGLTGGMSRGNYHLTWPFSWYLDSYRSVVLLTGLVGVSIAVLAAMFPLRLFNYYRVKGKSHVGVESVASIWRNSINYMCGAQRTGQRLKIASSINALDGKIQGIGADVPYMWWETMDYGKWGPMREAYESLTKVLGDGTMTDVMHSVRNCILEQDFDQDHHAFMSVMGKPMHNLRIEAVDLLRCCSGSANDAGNSAATDLIKFKMKRIKDRQSELCKVHCEKILQVDASNHDEQLRKYASFQDEYTFVFALSYWAEMISQLGTDLLAQNDRPRMPVTFLVKFLERGYKSWNLAELYHDKDGGGEKWKEHMSFALRNWISISLCYYLAVTGDGVLVREYSATMPMTLTLLISRFAGSAFRNNLKRMLGVILGKVLPICFLSILAFAPSDAVDGGWTKFCLQVGIVFVYYCAAEYVYFSSVGWGGLGCFCAGFGCFGLLQHQKQNMDTTGFHDNYSELIELTTCIFIQMSIDSMASSKTARGEACEQIRQSLDDICESIEAFFNSQQAPLQSMKTHLEHANGNIVQAIDFVTDADPNMDVAPGAKTPFKVGFASKVIDTMKLLTSDLTILLTCAVRSEQRIKEHDESIKRNGWPILAVKPSEWTKDGVMIGSRSRLMNIASLKEQDSYYINKFNSRRGSVLESNGKSKAKEVCEHARAVTVLVNESLKKSDESTLGCGDEEHEKTAGKRLDDLLDEEPELENNQNRLDAFAKSVFSDVVTLLDTVESNMKVHVDAKGGTKLGINWDTSMHITEVSEGGGLMSLWNSENAAKVTIGSKIHSVNNKTDPNEMSEELKQSIDLFLDIEPASQGKSTDVVRMTDDLMVRAAVMITAVHNVSSHLGMLDEACIEANIH